MEKFSGTILTDTDDSHSLTRNMKLNTKKEISEDFFLKLRPDKEQLETLKKVRLSEALCPSEVELCLGVRPPWPVHRTDCLHGHWS